MERIDQATLEWLAALVDREPTADERATLEANPALTDELAALKAQSEALGSLPRMQPPRGDWQMLEARLMSEGLIRHQKNRFLALPLSSGWTRLAAAAALFIGGTATGMSMSSADGVLSGPDATQVAAVDPASIQDVDAAAQAVQAAEQQYWNSLVRYRQLRQASGDPTSMDDRSRRQALDMLVQASESALRQAPDDPFINLFLLNTLEARQAATRSSRAVDNWF